MKCKACDYEHDVGTKEDGTWGVLVGDVEFISLSQVFPTSEWRHENTNYRLHVCPKCGTVRADEIW